MARLKFAARAKHIRCTVVRNEAVPSVAAATARQHEPQRGILQSKAFSGTVDSLMEEAVLIFSVVPESGLLQLVLDVG